MLTPRSLRVRLTVLVGSMILVSVWGMAWLIARVQEGHLRDLLAAQQYSVVDYVAANIDSDVRLRLDSLARVAERLPADILSDGQKLATFLQDRRAVYKLFDLGLVVVDTTGRQVMAQWPESPNRTAQQHAGHPCFEEAVRGRPAVGGPSRDAITGKPQITFAVPIHGEQGVGAVMIGAASITGPSFLGIVSNRRLGKSGDFLVAAPASGVFITGSNPSFILKPLPQPGRNLLRDRVMAGFEGSDVTVSSEGVEQLASVRRISATGWYVVARMTTSEAFAPISEMRWLVFGSAAVFSLLGSGVAALILGRALLPLRKAAATLDAMSQDGMPLAPLPLPADDETRQFVASFNRLEASLEREAAAARRMTAALERSLERYDDLVVRVPVGVYTLRHSAEGVIRFDYVSPRWCSMLGVTAAEALADAQVAFRLLHPEDAGGMLQHMELCRTRLQPFAWEGRVYTVDGDLRWLHVESQPTRLEDGTVTWQGIQYDITDRKRIEQQLRTSEERYRGLIETQGDFILRLDRDGSFVFVNEALARAVNLDAAVVTGRHWQEFIHADDIAATQSAIFALISGPRRRAHVENRLMLPGGVLRWVAWEGCAIADGDNTTIEVQATGRDITEWVENRDKLNSLVRDLDQSNRELEQFAYVASHDLREPLRMISSYVGLLERRYADKLDDSARDFINFARDGAQRMDRMVLDLLQFSRIGRLSAPFEPVPLAETFAEAIGNLAMTIQDQGAHITLPKDLPTITGCRSELVRLIQNLLGNALKYRHADRPPEITVTASEADGECTVGIADNGIGIAPEFHQRIFEIFQRLHGRGEYDGTGIGLAICRKIVQRHSGRIWVESRDGDGSTFFFTLPRG